MRKTAPRFPATTLTAEPVEVLPRPEFASELAARLRATSCATALLDAALDALSTVVPATACVACVPDGGAAGRC